MTVFTPAMAAASLDAAVRSLSEATVPLNVTTPFEACTAMVFDGTAASRAILSCAFEASWASLGCLLQAAAKLKTRSIEANEMSERKCARMGDPSSEVMSTRIDESDWLRLMKKRKFAVKAGPKWVPWSLSFSVKALREKRELIGFYADHGATFFIALAMGGEAMLPFQGRHELLDALAVGVGNEGALAIALAVIFRQVREFFF